MTSLNYCDQRHKQSIYFWQGRVSNEERQISLSGTRYPYRACSTTAQKSGPDAL